MVNRTEDTSERFWIIEMIIHVRFCDKQVRRIETGDGEYHGSEFLSRLQRI